MYCLPIKAKSMEELNEKISYIINEYYNGYQVFEMNFSTPTDDCEWYSCLLLLTKDDEE